MTDYAARFIGPTMLLSGASTAITCPVYRDGALVTVSAATVAIINASNNTIVNTAATVPGGIPSYTVTTSDVSGQSISAPWIIEWTCTISGTSYTFRNDGALVYRMLFPVVTDADLLRTHKDLTARRPASVTSYQDYLDEAWAKIQTRLLAMQKRPWLIMSPSSLRELHEYTALSLIFRDFATGGSGTAEWEMSKDYEAKADAQWSTLTFVQADETGKGLGARRRGARTSVWTNGRL